MRPGTHPLATAATATMPARRAIRPTAGPQPIVSPPNPIRTDFTLRSARSGGGDLLPRGTPNRPTTPRAGAGSWGSERKPLLDIRRLWQASNADATADGEQAE